MQKREFPYSQQAKPWKNLLDEIEGNEGLISKILSSGVSCHFANQTWLESFEYLIESTESIVSSGKNVIGHSSSYPVGIVRKSLKISPPEMGSLQSGATSSVATHTIPISE